MDLRALEKLGMHLADPQPEEVNEESLDLYELEEELLKPSRGESIALWLNIDTVNVFSPAFKEKVLEIQERYKAGEWDGKPALRRKPAHDQKRTQPTSRVIPPATAQYNGSVNERAVSSLYEEGSFLWAMYPPLELLKDRPKELERVELAEAIDTFLECAPEEEVQAFLALEKGEA